jgi:hypothetical protein
MSAKFDITPALIGGIKNQMSMLVDPPAVVKSGPVTATMSWDLGSTDVDLHIYEPNGSHVYYLNTKGTSGFLDLDNISGYGPEHYYTDCNQLQVGEYVFALNYFRDRMDEENNVDDAKPTRPVTSNVTITVPGATRTFNLTMSSDIDIGGNNAPTKVAKVVVEKIVDPNPNLNGKLKYKIVPL